ncbi:MAG TPA: NAD-dependent epimerase/dehydratase family protein [Streptosporangiaceae bacterium]|jgi:nucleoside-diphosphate-sugar epimerase
MRLFLAGATGVIGIRLIPLLTAAGHTVAGLTRTPAKAEALARLGAEPVVCDVYDTAALTAAVTAFGPDTVLHELTDLPDDERDMAAHAAANQRIRREGTASLLAAAAAAGATGFLAQSVAWELPGESGAAKAALEDAVLAADGVVLRYGRFYGPGTYYEHDLPGHPRIHLDEAAHRTVQALGLSHAIVTIAEDAEPSDRSPASGSG